MSPNTITTMKPPVTVYAESMWQSDLQLHLQGAKPSSLIKPLAWSNCASN